ncbi:unnamed protein product [Closterium sp. Naga37s-1]|nr:unnamed protein product [Closterium sp. Naga37s-1]
MGDPGEPFSLDLHGPGASALRSVVRDKLADFSESFTDDVLAEYVVVLVAHGKPKTHAAEDLEAFLGDQTAAFVDWLWVHLSANSGKYNAAAAPDTAGEGKDGKEVFVKEEGKRDEVTREEGRGREAGEVRKDGEGVWEERGREDRLRDGRAREERAREGRGREERVREVRGRSRERSGERGRERGGEKGASGEREGGWSKEREKEREGDRRSLDGRTESWKGKRGRDGVVTGREEERGRGYEERGRGYEERGRGHEEKGRGYEERGRGYKGRLYMDEVRGADGEEEGGDERRTARGTERGTERDVWARRGGSRSWSPPGKREERGEESTRRMEEARGGLDRALKRRATGEGGGEEWVERHEREKQGEEGGRERVRAEGHGEEERARMRRLFGSSLGEGARRRATVDGGRADGGRADGGERALVRRRTEGAEGAEEAEGAERVVRVMRAEGAVGAVREDSEEAVRRKGRGAFALVGASERRIEGEEERWQAEEGVEVGGEEQEGGDGVERREGRGLDGTQGGAAGGLLVGKRGRQVGGGARGLGGRLWQFAVRDAVKPAREVRAPAHAHAAAAAAGVPAGASNVSDGGGADGAADEQQEEATRAVAVRVGRVVVSAPGRSATYDAEPLAPSFTAPRAASAGVSPGVAKAAVRAGSEEERVTRAEERRDVERGVERGEKREKDRGEAGEEEGGEEEGLEEEEGRGARKRLRSVVVSLPADAPRRIKAVRRQEREGWERREGREGKEGKEGSGGEEADERARVDSRAGGGGRGEEDAEGKEGAEKEGGRGSVWARLGKRCVQRGGDGRIVVQRQAELGEECEEGFMGGYVGGYGGEYGAGYGGEYMEGLRGVEQDMWREGAGEGVEGWGDGRGGEGGGMRVRFGGEGEEDEEEDEEDEEERVEGVGGEMQAGAKGGVKRGGGGGSRERGDKDMEKEKETEKEKEGKVSPVAQKQESVEAMRQRLQKMQEEMRRMKALQEKTAAAAAGDKAAAAKASSVTSSADAAPSRPTDQYHVPLLKSISFFPALPFLLTLPVSSLPPSLLSPTRSSLSTGDADDRSVLVSNVHFAATVAALTLHFAACGEICRVTMLTHPLTGRPRGCAYIEFATKEAVDKALALNDASFMSRPLKIIHKPHAAVESLPSATHAHSLPLYSQATSSLLPSPVPSPHPQIIHKPHAALEALPSAAPPVPAITLLLNHLPPFSCHSHVSLYPQIIHKPHAALEALPTATAPPISPSTRPARPLLTPTKLPSPALGTSPTALASHSARLVPAKAPAVGVMAQGVGVKAQAARRPSARGSLQWRRQPEAAAAAAAAVAGAASSDAASAPAPATAAAAVPETKVEGRGGVIGNGKEAVLDVTQKAAPRSAPVAAAADAKAGEIKG